MTGSNDEAVIPGWLRGGSAVAVFGAFSFEVACLLTIVTLRLIDYADVVNASLWTLFLVVLSLLVAKPRRTDVDAKWLLRFFGGVVATWAIMFLQWGDESGAVQDSAFDLLGLAMVVPALFAQYVVFGLLFGLLVALASWPRAKRVKISRRMVVRFGLLAAALAVAFPVLSVLATLAGAFAASNATMGLIAGYVAIMLGFPALSCVLCCLMARTFVRLLWAADEGWRPGGDGIEREGAAMHGTERKGIDWELVKENLALAAAVLVVVTFVVAFLTVDVEMQKARERARDEFAHSVVHTLALSNLSAYLEATEPSSGTTGWSIEVSDELREVMPALVEAYNADPSTEGGLDAAEILRLLDEEPDALFGVGECAAADRVLPFFKWCGEDADLVYGPGSADDRAGEDASNSIYSNLDQVMNAAAGDDYYLFTWEHDALLAAETVG